MRRADGAKLERQQDRLIEHFKLFNCMSREGTGGCVNTDAVSRSFPPDGSARRFC